MSDPEATDGRQNAEVKHGLCPCCLEECDHEKVDTSPHIETGEPIDRMECENCGAVSDRSDIGAAYLGGSA